MQIIFLGTGGALPTLYRWTSSIAFCYEGETLLFDCGEGAQVQFLKAKLKPGKLTRIFISHLHGDHLYGLIGLLTTMQLNGRDGDLNIYGPAGLKDYLAYMENLSKFKLQYKVNFYEILPEEKEVVWDFGKYTICSRPLKHRTQAYGYRFQEKDKRGKFNAAKATELGIPAGPLRARLIAGEEIVLPDSTRVKPSDVIGRTSPGKKVAICTDTKPCENAILLARHADLLIHEGTFSDAFSELAGETGHSTVKQAAEVAKKAGVKQLILTHISARFNEKQILDLAAEARQVFPNAKIAQDLMKVNI